eukprot:scaffold1970_cov114-Isochrysis_galbana.AAC.1
MRRMPAGVRAPPRKSPRVPPAPAQAKTGQSVFAVLLGLYPSRPRESNLSWAGRCPRRCPPENASSSRGVFFPGNGAHLFTAARAQKQNPVGQQAPTCTAYSKSVAPPVEVGARQPMVMAPSSASMPLSTTSGGEVGKFGSGEPYVWSSFFSLCAAAWIGMPVQWKPNGKSAFLPCIRWNATANSALVSEKAWPRCSRPFMYG